MNPHLPPISFAALTAAVRAARVKRRLSFEASVRVPKRPTAESPSRRQRALSTLGILVAVPVMLAVGVGGAAVPASKSPQPGDSSRSGDGKYQYAFGSGDRIKVRIFERDDLSGEYRVRPNGNIVMPIVGPVVAEGKDQAQLEQEIANALAHVTGGSANVVTDIVEWRPFYVAGYVTKPGAYAFVPGMTVLHAMAIAGGAYRPDMGFEMPGVAATRETGKMQTSVDGLMRSMARLARLQAEREGLSTVRPSDRLTALAGLDRATGLIELEQRILEQNVATFGTQLAALEKALEFSEREIQAQTAALQQSDARIQQNKAVLTDLEKLLQQQLTRRARVLEVSNMINGLEADRRNAEAAIARAQKTISDTTRDIDLLKLKRKNEIDTQLQDVEKQVEAGETSLNSSKTVIAAITNRAIGQSQDLNSRGDPDLDYFILRDGVGGKEFVRAEETTLMLPGDVLRVGRAPIPTAPELASSVPDAR